METFCGKRLRLFLFLASSNEPNKIFPRWADFVLFPPLSLSSVEFFISKSHVISLFYWSNQKKPSPFSVSRYYFQRVVFIFCNLCKLHFYLQFYIFSLLVNFAFIFLPPLPDRSSFSLDKIVIHFFRLHLVSFFSHAIIVILFH